MAEHAVVRVLREGDSARPYPFTICVVANPALESPWKSMEFRRDPILDDPRAFESAVSYVEKVLFGRLPQQAERFLGESDVEPHIRLVSLIAPTLEAAAENALIGEDLHSDVLMPRRTLYNAFLARFGLAADVVFAVSASESHPRSSAWPTSDDDKRGGIWFTLDGIRLCHRFWARTPGTIALHATASSLVALHEFSHALSSYTNGNIVDLYVDSPSGLNKKAMRPIPAMFAVYDGIALAADASRNGVGYPEEWVSYHCELNDRQHPAVMDNFWLAPDQVPERCQHDRITRMFLLDRIRAKLRR